MRSLQGFAVSRALAFSLMGAVGLAASPAEAAPPTAKGKKTSKVEELSVDGLLRSFAKMPGLYTKFREEKHMALLAAPLVNEGTLHYANGRLARHTTSPMRSSVVIDSERIQFGDENGREQVELAGNPVVRLFVDSFVKILAGDRAALERIYAMKFTVVDASTRRWKLVLVPKVDPLDKIIDRMELEGTELVVSGMLLVEKGGDETVTTFTEVDVNRRYSSAEADRIFRVPGK